MKTEELLKWLDRMAIWPELRTEDDEYYEIRALIENRPRPKQYRCELCGAIFYSKIFSHGRAEMGRDGKPIEVECGPITEEDADD